MQTEKLHQPQLGFDAAANGRTCRRKLQVPTSILGPLQYNKLCEHTLLLISSHKLELTCHPKDNWIVRFEAPTFKEKVEHVGIECSIELQPHVRSAQHLSGTGLVAERTVKYPDRCRGSCVSSSKESAVGNRLIRSSVSRAV